MKLTMTVTYNDQATEQVTATLPDLCAFEDHFSRSVARFEIEMRLTDIAWLAWHRLKRSGKAGDDFTAWLDGVESVLPEADKIVPLESPAPTGR